MLNNYIELIGFLGSLLLSLCGFPQALQCIKTKKAEGLTTWFILLWTFGELFMLSYVLVKYIHDIPLLINYVISAFSVSVLFYYKFKNYIILSIYLRWINDIKT